jgi:hypothetical protein
MTLEQKIQRADKVELYYKSPYEYRYALIENYCREKVNTLQQELEEL